MRSNAGMANRQGDVALHKSRPPVNALAGGKKKIQKEVTSNTHIKKGLIKTEDTTPDCPAT